MSVKVLYFASLKEALGMGSEAVELPAGVTTVGSLRDWLASQGRDKLASAPTRVSPALSAVNSAPTSKSACWTRTVKVNLPLQAERRRSRRHP